jgi:hypothetical protein
MDGRTAAEVVKALAWPGGIVVLGVVFRKQLNNVLGGLATFLSRSKIEHMQGPPVKELKFPWRGM